MKTADWIGLGVVALACVAGLGHSFGAGFSGENVQRTDTLSPATRARGFSPELEKDFADRLAALFGTFRTPLLPPGGMPGVVSQEQLERGRAGYAVKCAQCHGLDGGADTGTARLLFPRPRSFREGILKFSSTPAGSPPLRRDVERVLERGIPTTSMASFRALPPSARNDLAAYVMYLLERGATEQRAVAKADRNPPASGVRVAWEEVRGEWEAAREIPVPEESAADPASRERGRALFQGERAACASCHGIDGRGRGPAAWDPGSQRWILRDLWGQEARPRDFRGTPWFGGSEPEDLYRRIHNGIPGTPMPAFGGRLSPDEIWDLVHYVQALAAGDAPPVPEVK